MFPSHDREELSELNKEIRKLEARKSELEETVEPEKVGKSANDSVED